MTTWRDIPPDFCLLLEELVRSNESDTEVIARLLDAAQGDPAVLPKVDELMSYSISTDPLLEHMRDLVASAARGTPAPTLNDEDRLLVVTEEKALLNLGPSRGFARLSLRSRELLMLEQSARSLVQKQDGDIARRSQSRTFRMRRAFGLAFWESISRLRRPANPDWDSFRKGYESSLHESPSVVLAHEIRALVGPASDTDDLLMRTVIARAVVLLHIDSLLDKELSTQRITLFT